MKVFCQSLKMANHMVGLMSGSSQARPVPSMCNRKIPKFPRRDSKSKKRLRENRAITNIDDNDTHGVTLISWSLFLGLESLLRNSASCHRLGNHAGGVVGAANVQSQGYFCTPHLSLSIYIYIYIYVYLSLAIYLSISLSLSLYIYIYIYIYPTPISSRTRQARATAAQRAKFGCGQMGSTLMGPLHK